MQIYRKEAVVKNDGSNNAAEKGVMGRLQMISFFSRAKKKKKIWERRYMEKVNDT